MFSRLTASTLLSFCNFFSFYRDEGLLKTVALFFFQLVLYFYISAVPLLTYLLMKGELTPEEINMNSIGMFRAGVDTVNA